MVVPSKTSTMIVPNKTNGMGDKALKLSNTHWYDYIRDCLASSTGLPCNGVFSEIQKQTRNDSTVQRYGLENLKKE